MAFILIQHLDPTHESMMVDLLAGPHVDDGATGNRGHAGRTRPPLRHSSWNLSLCWRRRVALSQPHARHGARLPFDFLLHSLADQFGARAVCVILSGTGADGSLGLKAVKENGGFVIAQNPDEAGYDGMPRNAILTGEVDSVSCRSRRLPGALVNHVRQMSMCADARMVPTRRTPQPDWLSEIIDLLRAKTAHDFTLYKKGTLQRRIERRMAMSSIETGDMKRYLEVLRGDANETRTPGQGPAHQCHEFLSRPASLRFLAEKINPELVRDHPDRSAATHLDCRLQHGRGDLFPRDTFPRGDRSVQTKHQTAGLRVRRRPRCGCECTRGSLSGNHRG